MSTSSRASTLDRALFFRSIPASTTICYRQPHPWVYSSLLCLELSILPHVHSKRSLPFLNRIMSCLMTAVTREISLSLSLSLSLYLFMCGYSTRGSRGVTFRPFLSLACQTALFKIDRMPKRLEALAEFHRVSVAALSFALDRAQSDWEVQTSPLAL